MKTDMQPTRLADYRAPAFLIERTDLDFVLDPVATRVTARLEMRRREGATDPLVLDGDDLKLVGVSIDGKALPPDRYSATPDRLEIASVPTDPFILEIETEIDPSANTELMGLYLSSGTYCTQCEAEGFRRITYYLDRPDVLSVYTTRIEAPRADAPVILANGNLVDSGDIPGTDRQFAVWHDPFPKPAYLFALIAGDLGRITDEFTTASGRKVDLAIYCEHGKEERCLYAMDSLKRAMRWDEEVYGREYDLDVFNIVAVSYFNMGAMENKGLNIFNDRYVLADAETATDVDYARVEGVIAHEYFHNWSGNRVTCRDWFQLCLKEGFTVFRDQSFSADMRSRTVKRIDDVRTLKARQFPEDGGPLAHPVRPEIYHEISNFYTATVYEKGAELVRMLHALVGAGGFRKATDLYFERHDGEAATVEDFLAAFADANDIDLGQFKLWYSQAGTPEVAANGHYDPASKRYTLTLRQSTPATPGQPTKKPLHIPVRFGLVGPNGGDAPYTAISGATVTDDVIHLTQASQTVLFDGVAERPVPSLLRGFSAPVSLAAELTAAELVFLLRADSDPFNRWQAGQTLSARALVATTAAIRRGKAPPAHTELVAALGDVAGDDTLDPAARAQILSLPSETDIAREIGRDVDPQAVADARLHLLSELGRAHERALLRVYSEYADTGPYRPDAEGHAKRALRNTALQLMLAGDPAHAAIALDQFETSTNLTDRVEALAALNAIAAPGRVPALAAFRERFTSDPLVLDKWLALEATAPVDEVVECIRELMREPGISFDNPNRLRALIGSFASANHTQFNRPDGAGYDLVAETVLALNRKNPQLAARLLVSFRSWRSLEETRRNAAEKALRRIAETQPLSRDVNDIITRILA